MKLKDIFKNINKKYFILTVLAKLCEASQSDASQMQNAECRIKLMTALPSIHELHAIHEPTAQFTITKGGEENPYREGFSVKSAKGR